MNPSRSLILHSPALNVQFDFFSSGVAQSAERADILARQWEIERRAADRSAARIKCCCCENPLAAFVVHRRVRRGREHYYLCRMQRTARWHADTCYAHRQELPVPTGEGTPDRALRRGDLAALWGAKGDPETKRARSSSSDYRPTERTSRGSSRSAGLRRLGTLLLDRAGIFEWHPRLLGRRTFAVVSGRIGGALSALLRQVDNPFADLLTGVQFDHGPWSLASARMEHSRVLSFGWIVGSDWTERGSLRLRFHAGDAPLVVASEVVENAIKNPQVRSHLSQPRHPLLVFLVAELFGGIWKAHNLVGYWLSVDGMVPIESAAEQEMTRWLIEKRRHFRKVVDLPSGLNSKPDFELLDTDSDARWIEVAGCDNSDYLDHLDARQKCWGDRVIVWHAYKNQPLDAVVLPPKKPAGRDTRWSSSRPGDGVDALREGASQI